MATDPPYNVQLKMTMAGGPLAQDHANRRTDYAMVSELDADLANLPDYAAFLDAMGEVLGEVHRVLKPGRYAALIVRDAYQEGRYVFTASDLAARASGVGLVPKGDIAWYQAGTRLRPYGYPRSFVPNIAHQHILVLRKPPHREAGLSVGGRRALRDGRIRPRRRTGAATPGTCAGRPRTPRRRGIVAGLSSCRPRLACR